MCLQKHQNGETYFVKKFSNLIKSGKGIASIVLKHKVNRTEINECMKYEATYLM